MIVIPDTHGRNFWQAPIQEYIGREHIVFLGDYLDPYPNERVTTDQAFRQLQYIVEFKEAHPDEITLLLGNHDIHYLSPLGKASRFDLFGGARNRLFFLQHADRFQLTYGLEACGRKFLFSHAGILAGWLECHREDLDDATAEGIGSELNRMWAARSCRPVLFSVLADIPESRWGMARYGSPVRSDVNEMRTDAPELPGYYQIFGHSQQPGAPVINDYFACLDCRKAFRLTNDGIIEDL